MACGGYDKTVTKYSNDGGWKFDKKTKFKDLLIISERTHYDKRGFLREILLEKIIITDKDQNTKLLMSY